jgi:hypothetical protein
MSTKEPDEKHVEQMFINHTAETDGLYGGKIICDSCCGMIDTNIRPHTATIRVSGDTELYRIEGIFCESCDKRSLEIKREQYDELLFTARLTPELKGRPAKINNPRVIDRSGMNDSVEQDFQKVPKTNKAAGMVLGTFLIGELLKILHE